MCFNLKRGNQSLVDLLAEILTQVAAFINYFLKIQSFKNKFHKNEIENLF